MSGQVAANFPQDARVDEAVSLNVNRRYGGVYELVMNGEPCQSVRGRDYSDELY